MRLVERLRAEELPGDRQRHREARIELHALLNEAADEIERGSPAISLDGPHPPSDHRVWLARQLLDSKLSDDEAYGIVAWFPAVSDIWKAAAK